MIPLPGHSKPSCDLETVVVRSTCNRFLVPFHRFRPAHELVRVLHTCTTSRAHIRARNACTAMCECIAAPAFVSIDSRARARRYFANLPSKYRGCCCVSCCPLLQFGIVIGIMCVCLTIESRYVIWNDMILPQTEKSCCGKAIE